MPRSRAAAIATTAKASLISKRSTSPTDHPALSSSLRIAGIGAVVYHAGAWEWVAWALISARIGRPSRSARERRGRGNAPAPPAARAGAGPPGGGAGREDGVGPWGVLTGPPPP